MLLICRSLALISKEIYLRRVWFYSLEKGRHFFLGTQDVLDVPP